MLIYNVSYGDEEQGGGKYKPPTTFLSAFETVRKYLLRFDDNKMLPSGTLRLRRTGFSRN
jgi:hypothetical protein